MTRDIQDDGLPLPQTARRKPPELAPGQIWEAQTATRHPKTRFRHILWCGRAPAALATVVGPGSTVGYVRSPDAPQFPETGHDSYVSIEGFRSWIRKNNARLISPAGYAEAKDAPLPGKRSPLRLR